jgi:dihydrofolate synthase/folylpolyglutamate synthase
VESEIFDWIEQCKARGVRPGLARMRSALDRLGHPQKAWPSILVGGTNGKGSTVAFCESLLRASGLTTGVTISPHLTDLRERFRLDGEVVEHGALEATWRELKAGFAGTDLRAELSYFEATTVIAFVMFRQRRVRSAVVEVGMGGELDASRTCDPTVAVLVSVDEEHMEWLGPTIQDVARTKARIAPPQGVLVCGERRKDRAPTIQAEVEEAGATLWLRGRDFDAAHGPRGFDYDGPFLSLRGVRLGLVGPHQADNAACACAAVEAFCSRLKLPVPRTVDVEAALARARAPGRFEVVHPWRDGATIILDGAHNPAGGEALAATLAARRRPHRRMALFAAMGDKDWPGTLSAVAPQVDGVVCVRGFTTDRYADPAVLAQSVRQNHPTLSVRQAQDPAAALSVLRAELGAGDELLVFGSLYLLGEVRPLLGLGIG